MDSYKSLISEFGEKELIKIIINKVHSSQSYFKETSDLDEDLNKNPDILIGDDSALIEIQDFNSKDSYIVASSDMLSQDKHFPKQMSYYYMGWKSVTANVSDIVAMGAKPIGFLLSLAVPKDLTIIAFKNLIDGVVNACSYYNMPLIGGDLNEASQIIISGTALGRVKKGKSLKKFPFYEGDVIALSGEIGVSATGTQIMLSDTFKLHEMELLPEEVYRIYSDCFKPVVNLNDALLAADSEYVSACTDISDGLAVELYEFLNSNQSYGVDKDLGLRIYEEKLPIPDLVYKVADIMGKNPLDLAIHYGEDFELIYIVKKEFFEKFKELIDVYYIGEVTNSSKVEFVTKEGKVSKFPNKGYEHLKED